jgi:photosystem II stability/assembly factor-like uncharacterized protein
LDRLVTLRLITTSACALCAVALIGGAADATPRAPVEPSRCAQDRYRDQTREVSAISFWDSERAVVGENARIGGPPAPISLSEDGGRTFTRVAEFADADVDWLETAGELDAWAVLCEGGRLGIPRLVHSADAGTTWETVPLVIRRADGSAIPIAGEFIGPSFSTPADGVATQHVDGAYPLLITADGGRSWIRRAGPPCYDGMVASSVRPGVIQVLCKGEGSTGGQGRWIYASRDNGRTWEERVGVAVFDPCQRGMCEYGYPAGLSYAPDGTGLFTNTGRESLSVTTNGGRRWRDVSVRRRNLVGAIATGIVSRQHIYAIYRYAPRHPTLFVTHNGGRKWVATHRWR